MDQLVPLSNYPDVKTLFSNTIVGIQGLNGDFQILKDEGIDIITLIDSHSLFVPRRVAKFFATEPTAKPNSTFFQNLPSVFSLSSEELLSSFITYATSVRYSAAALAEKAEHAAAAGTQDNTIGSKPVDPRSPLGPQSLPDPRPAIRVGSMTAEGKVL